MKYELINPSDKIFFDASSDDVAFFVSLMVGGGVYGSRNIETGKTSKMYIFGIEDDVLIIELGMEVDIFIKINRDDINDSLQSFRIDGERTSMNDIVTRAHGMKLKESA